MYRRYYAVINDNNIVYMIIDTSIVYTEEKYIEIGFYNESIIGCKYENGLFVAPNVD